MGALATVAGFSASAQNFPAKQVRIVVPYPSGGGNDILARLLAQKLGDKWGQNVVVDNRGGASGMIGAELVAKSAPDGYTLLLCASPECALNTTLYSKMAYDPQRDLQPITLLALSALALTVHPSLPVRDVRNYIALAKQRPGEISYSTVGAGSPHHISGEWLKMLAGINITHVPYKGGGPQLTDLMGGHVQSGFVALPVLMPHVRGGRVRVIGVTTAKRSAALPDVASIAEAGLGGLDVAQWYGVMAPAGTPAEIVAGLNGELNDQIKSPDVRSRMLELGAEPAVNSVSQFAAFIRTEVAKYQKIVRAMSITVN